MGYVVMVIVAILLLVIASIFLLNYIDAKFEEKGISVPFLEYYPGLCRKNWFTNSIGTIAAGLLFLVIYWFAFAPPPPPPRPAVGESWESRYQIYQLGLSIGHRIEPSHQWGPEWRYEMFRAIRANDPNWQPPAHWGPPPW